ncbi:hypothetical protein FB45DRAFT_387819 [Roridomyces roridus]|uniref:Uncharacterized protein n=1 Tax=Roridomyces roridus TaxID=1738132 RepID=A0AAD7F8D0_9AGAR|nr:hypothetical protein FB45DRAFT_387819 [Roridomyces roridus]
MSMDRLRHSRISGPYVHGALRHAGFLPLLSKSEAAAGLLRNLKALAPLHQVSAIFAERLFHLLPFAEQEFSLVARLAPLLRPKTGSTVFGRQLGGQVQEDTPDDDGHDARVVARYMEGSVTCWEGRRSDADDIPLLRGVAYARLGPSCLPIVIGPSDWGASRVRRLVSWQSWAYLDRRWHRYARTTSCLVQALDVYETAGQLYIHLLLLSIQACTRCILLLTYNPSLLFTSSAALFVADAALCASASLDNSQCCPVRNGNLKLTSRLAIAFAILISLNFSCLFLFLAKTAGLEGFRGFRGFGRDSTVRLSDSAPFPIIMVNRVET